MVTPTGSRATQTVQTSAPEYASFYIYWQQRTRRWQRAPYNLPLSYDYEEGRCDRGGSLISVLGTPPYDAQHIPRAFYDATWFSQMNNRSYENLRGKVYDRVGAGVDFVEYRQGMDMITRAGGTIVRAANQVRHGNFLGAARTLRTHVVPPNVSTRKSFANNWLEFHFGWSPLMGDIHDACEVLNNPLKRFCRTSAVAKDVKIWRQNVNSGAVTDYRQNAATLVYRQGLTVKSIDNIGLHGLDQFGILNPAVLAWELVPFSFVVDWFVGVGDFLQSLTDYAGMTLESTYTSFVLHCYNWGTILPNPGYTGTPRSYAAQGVWMQRRPGLAGPNLALKQFKLPSKERAATAVSLVIQQFSR